MSNPLDDRLRRVLNFDPLDAAEKMTGTSYKENDRTTRLGMALALKNNRSRADLLKAAEDTNYSEPVERYNQILTLEGFQCVAVYPFVGRDSNPETLQIWWNDKEGLLVRFDTFTWPKEKQVVNSSHCYFNLKVEGERGWPPHSSGTFRGDVWVGDFDAREGFRFHLRELRKLGGFVSPWVEKPFLYLVGYGEDRDRYKEISNQRIEALPEEIRKRLGEERE